MKLLIPFIPHLAQECLELHQAKNIEEWPIIEKNLKSKIKMAIQINGKTRDIIDVDKDLSEGEIKNIVLKNSKAKKYVENIEIMKTIFVKNKIINYIIALK